MIKKSSVKFVIVSMVLLLIIILFSLPSLALKYFTYKINKDTEYSVKVADLSLSPLQGKISLIKIRLWKKKPSDIYPSLIADKISVSIYGRDLLKGKLTSKIDIQHPVITIHFLPSQEKKQKIQPHTVNQVKSESNFHIHQITIHNGEIYFKNNQTENPFNFYIKNINSKIKTTYFSLNAKVMDDAPLNIDGKFNLSNQSSPNLYIKGELKGLSLPKINSFLKEYTEIKTKSGLFSLFFETAIAKERIKGYAKPFVKNLEIEKEKEASLGQKIYEGAVSIASKILKNTEQKSTATQVNISGKIDDPDVSIFSVVKYLLYHAFIQALLPTVDNKISMHDVVYPEKTPEKPN